MRTVASSRIGLGATLAALVALGAEGQGAFQKELGDVAAIEREVDLSMMNGNTDGADSGRGPVPYYRALGAPPKRVALISFYVWDAGEKKENLFFSSYRNVQMEAVDIFANEWYDAGIAPLKESFAAVGMQLLTPSEFLDTPEKQAAYKNFELEGGAAQRFLRFAENRDEGVWHNLGPANGYSLIRLYTNGNVDTRDFRLAAQGAGVGKIAQQLGYDLVKQLGVDATLIVYNVIQAKRTGISLVGSYAYMFGPNPVPESGQSLYWQGHQYSGVFLKMNVPFVTTDRDGAALSSDYAGYALVAQALGNRMAAHLQEKTTGAGK